MTVRYRHGIVVAATLVLLPALAACSSTSADQSTGGFVSGDGAITKVKPAERKPAPDLTGPDLDGNNVSLADFEGKTVVVNVWGSWCGSCREEAPALAATSKDLKADDVEFLGIAIRDKTGNAKAFNRRWKIDYPSIDDPTSQTLLGFGKSLPAVAIPTTYIIDERGRVAVRILDKTTQSTLTGLVEDVQAGS